MAIDSVLNPAGIAQKLSIPQLQKAIQDGTIPPYIGVPMLQQKVQMEQRMRNASAQPQQGQPSIAQQVMAEAQGVSQLPSNLPAEYAGGGIVAFARGGIPDIEAEQFDEDSEDEMNDEISRIMRQMRAMQNEAYRANESMREPGGVSTFTSSSNIPGFTSTEVKKGVSIKEGDQPARTVEEREKSVTKPAGIDDLLSMIEKKESGGRRYGKDGQLLTSPKGALGEMQVMPATARDPGFGIRPADVSNPDELRRVGREYFGKLMEKYGDPKLAAIAYNMGPGATDKWLMAGADPGRLPDETRKYAQGFAEGGIASIKRFQYGGISGTMPYGLADLGIDDLTRMARMGEPGAAEELMRRRASAPSGNLLDRIFGQSPEEMRSAAERRLRMEQARGAFSGVQPAAPAAPAAPATPSAPVDERSLLRRGSEATGRGAGSFFGDLLRTGPLARGLGIGALMTPVTANANEQEELERRRQMPPTITTTEKLRPMAPPPSRGVVVPPFADSDVAEQADRMTGLPSLIAPEFADSDAAEQADRMTGTITPEAVAKAVEIAPESEFLKRLQDRISKGYAKLDKQEETDKYLALLSAGLGIMSGTSPFGLSNIGRGGMMGVQSLMQSDASRAAQEAKLMNAELLAERIRTYGETAKEAREARKETSSMLEQGRKERAFQVEEGKTENRRIRAGQVASQMEKSAIDRAEATARAAVKANPMLAMDETKTAEFIEQARSAARAKLNTNPLYRRYVKEATEGFDPGEFDVGSDINDLLTKYLKPKK